MAWHSILSGQRRQRALAAARTIADELVIDPAGIDEAWSAIQRAFTLWEYGRLTGTATHAAAAEAMAARAIELAASETLPGRFVDGAVGLAWMLEVMQDEPGDDDEIDRAVAALVARPAVPSTAHFDLISGLVGAGVYFLARPASAARTAALTEIVYRLEETAEFGDDGIAWWGYTVLGPGLGADGFNCGVAHGVAGIVALLARLSARGIARADRLLDGAMRWLLGHRIAGGPSRFPMICTRHGHDGPARAAWCYGDPGAALALFAAASLDRSGEWERGALDVALHAAARAHDDCGVVDASVCHGAAGLVHVFARLAHAAGDHRLADAAASWVDPTLELLAAGRWDGVPMDHASELARISNVLDGKAGIALALAGVAGEVEPRWDAMLLADVGALPSSRARAVA